MKLEQLEEKMKEYKKSRIVFEDTNLHSLVPFFQNRARHNLETAKILWKISEEDETKKVLKISEDYVGYDWVISTSYYAMYHSALAALSEINMKTTTHEATIHVLEYHFIHHKALLETEYIEAMKEAQQLEIRYINKLWTAKRTRAIAQYEADKTMSKEDSERLLFTAEDLVNRMDKLIHELDMVSKKKLPSE